MIHGLQIWCNVDKMNYIGIAVECELSWSGAWTDGKASTPLSTWLSVNNCKPSCHSIVWPRVWLHPQDPQYWLYVVLSRSEHFKLAVSRVDSHWKAITERRFSKIVSCLEVQKSAVSRSAHHQHEPRLWKGKSLFLINQIITVYRPSSAERTCCQSCSVSSWSVTLSVGSVGRLHTPDNPA